MPPTYDCAIDSHFVILLRLFPENSWHWFILCHPFQIVSLDLIPPTCDCLLYTTLFEPILCHLVYDAQYTVHLWSLSIYHVYLCSYYFILQHAHDVIHFMLPHYAHFSSRSLLIIFSTKLNIFNCIFLLGPVTLVNSRLYCIYMFS